MFWVLSRMYTPLMQPLFMCVSSKNKPYSHADSPIPSLFFHAHNNLMFDLWEVKGQTNIEFVCMEGKLGTRLAFLVYMSALCCSMVYSPCCTHFRSWRGLCFSVSKPDIRTRHYSELHTSSTGAGWSVRGKHDGEFWSEVDGQWEWRHCTGFGICGYIWHCRMQ